MGESMQGEVHPDFQSVADHLQEIVADDGRGGGAVAVYQRGEKVVDVWTGAKDAEGAPWEADTIAVSFSTTKGVTATALHMCAERGLVDYDDPVAKHWPEFAQGGKDKITVRQLLCHEAGLYPIRTLIDDASRMYDWEHMIDVLSKAEPVHEPGERNGYHGLTYGWLVGEVVRRVSGRSVGTFVRDEIAEPLGLDGLFIGVPESELPRLATLLGGGGPGLAQLAENRSPEAAGPMAEIAKAMGLEIDVEAMVDALMPPGDGSWVTSVDMARAEVPAAGGAFTARSLAKMYAALANGGSLDGVTLMSPERVRVASTPQNDRPDIVIVLPMNWRLGYHMAFTDKGIPPHGFGHFGFGGSGGWCDPDTGLAVAFTCNRLGGQAVGDQRMAALGGAAWEAAKLRV